MACEVPSGLELLERVIPFQFLPRARREALAARLELREFAPGELLVRRGESSRDVFFLARGSVETVDDRDPPLVLSTVEAGHYFGERAALFDQRRTASIRAREAVAAYTLPGLDFLHLVDEEPTFAQALANTLKVKQGIFLPYQRLYARILGLIDRREFLLSELIAAYRELQPALHPLIADRRIDTDALAYAVARLPEDVTRTTFYYLTGDLPPLYEDPDSKLWKPMPGKTLVLLRDGISDVSDLLTCMCLYAIEAKKIRKRVRSSELLRELKDLALEEDARPDDPRGRALLDRTDLSAEERQGLLRIWPRGFWRHLRDILLHHEDIALECDTPIDNYNSRASEEWVSQIRERARDLVDLEDPSLRVHIISSNTHSVANCLSPWAARRRDAILAWGLEHRRELCGQPTRERPWGGDWAVREDLVYALARDWAAEAPSERDAWQREEAAAGRYHLTSTAFTGIEVDLFDLLRLEPEATDPAVRARRPRHPTLIVNVDYAFGQQAEEILSNLLFLFGRRVRSVNVLGKAGALVGKRGELLLPRATLLQTNDELYALPGFDLPASVLRALAPGRAVHEGPVLTVAGTLLQDRNLLHFYRRIWKCVGLEMEGSFFARPLLSAVQTGVVDPGVASRFAYYTSDVPLRPEENLSEALSPLEGLPPLYAITRAFLQRIFAAEDF